MATTEITNNSRESLTIEHMEGKIYQFRILQETKGQFPDYPTKRVIILTTKEAQALAQFIQDAIVEE